jgi:hypothetical protein
MALPYIVSAIPGVSCRRSPDVDHSTGLNLFDGEMNHLVLGNVDDNKTDLELGDGSAEIPSG